MDAKVLEDNLKVQDKYAEKNHKRKADLLELKYDLKCKLLDKRDVFSVRRHAEKLEAIYARKE